MISNSYIQPLRKLEEGIFSIEYT